MSLYGVDLMSPKHLLIALVIVLLVFATKPLRRRIWRD
jgi:Sec-independent protein translocase protein TatA